MTTATTTTTYEVYARSIPTAAATAEIVNAVSATGADEDILMASGPTSFRPQVSHGSLTSVWTQAHEVTGEDLALSSGRPARRSMHQSRNDRAEHAIGRGRDNDKTNAVYAYVHDTVTTYLGHATINCTDQVVG